MWSHQSKPSFPHHQNQSLQARGSSFEKHCGGVRWHRSPMPTPTMPDEPMDGVGDTHFWPQPSQPDQKPPSNSLSGSWTILQGNPQVLLQWAPELLPRSLIRRVEDHLVDREGLFSLHWHCGHWKHSKKSLCLTFLWNPPTSHILPDQLAVFLKSKDGTIETVSLAAFRTPFAPKNITDLLQRFIKVKIDYLERWFYSVMGLRKYSKKNKQLGEEKYEKMQIIAKISEICQKPCNVKNLLLTLSEWVQIQVPSWLKSAKPIHQFLNKKLTKACSKHHSIPDSS